MKGKTGIKTNSNRDSKKECNLSTGQVILASISSVHIHQHNGSFLIEEFVGKLDWNTEPTTKREYHDVDFLEIIMLKDGRCVFQQTYSFNPIDGGSDLHVRFYDFYRLKSVNQSRDLKCHDVLSVMMEMI